MAQGTPSFRRVCEEFKDLLPTVAVAYLPGRLLAAIHFNIKHLDLGIAKNELDPQGYRELLKAYAYGLYKLLSENDTSGMPLLVELLERKGEKILTEELSKVAETAYLLFPASQNIEPYKVFLVKSGIGPEKLATLIVKTAHNLEKTIMQQEGMFTEDEKASTFLHLSRAIAEVSRTAYSMSLNLQEARPLLGCGKGSKVKVYECLFAKAMELADKEVEGASIPRIPILGYIQVTSTLTRTDLWKKQSYKAHVEEKLREARKVLEEAGITQLAEYEALSLEGSYHYNNGWLMAVSERFDEAGESFRRAYRSFFKLERDNYEIPLGFLRGVYVSLWNYYLMWFNHDLITRGEVGKEKLEDAICWGERTREAISKSSLAGLIWKMGTHAYYAYALSITATSLLGGYLPEPDESFLSGAPERIKLSIDTIRYVLRGELGSALMAAREAGAKRIVQELLNSLLAKDRVNIENLIIGKEVLEKYALTVREWPVLQYIKTKAREENWEGVRKGIALLALYTL